MELSLRESRPWMAGRLMALPPVFLRLVLACLARLVEISMPMAWTVMAWVVCMWFISLMVFQAEPQPMSTIVTGLFGDCFNS